MVSPVHCLLSRTSGEGEVADPAVMQGGAIGFVFGVGLVQVASFYHFHHIWGVGWGVPESVMLELHWALVFGDLGVVAAVVGRAVVA